MSYIRWGIIGPGNIAHNFADGLNETSFGKLEAIASTNDDRREKFAKKYNIEKSLCFNNYEELINSNFVDAIYISTPHNLHAELSIKAAGKGKHILCEKPAAINLEEGKTIIEAVRQAGVFYMEGFMYRCHPQIQTLVKLLNQKKIGDIKHIKSSFGFDMGKTVKESRLFRTDLAGGAILDVGLYPVSLSRMVAGLAVGKKFLNPIKLEGKAKIGETEVDEISHANLNFSNGIRAEVSTAIRENMPNNAIITGEKGMIEIDNPWTPGREGGPYNAKIKIIINNESKIIELKGPEHLFFFEADLASKAILNEQTEISYPGMTWEDTLGNLKTLDDWRKSIKYSLPNERENEIR